MNAKEKAKLTPEQLAAVRTLEYTARRCAELGVEFVYFPSGGSLYAINGTNRVASKWEDEFWSAAEKADESWVADEDVCQDSILMDIICSADDEILYFKFK